MTCQNLDDGRNALTDERKRSFLMYLKFSSVNKTHPSDSKARQRDNTTQDLPRKEATFESGGRLLFPAGRR